MIIAIQINKTKLNTDALLVRHVSGINGPATGAQPGFGGGAGLVKRPNV